MIARSPTVWYSAVTIDVGSGEGVAVNDPVIDGDGLVGRVAAVTGGSAQVTLISDHSSAVSAKVVPQGVQGVVKPVVGNSDELILDFLDSSKQVHRGETVVTAGWRAQGLASLFPPNLPVGEVTERLDRRTGGAPTGVTCVPTPTCATSKCVQVLTGGWRRVIVTPKILARIVAIVVARGAAPAQLLLAGRASFTSAPTSCPALVVSLGLLGGTMTGVVAGFSVGFLIDCLLIEPLGGQLPGAARHRLPRRPVPRALRDPQPARPAAALHGADPVRRAGVRRCSSSCSGSTPRSAPLVLRDMLIKSIYAFFLGWPIYLGVRRALRPALVEDPTVRRRRQPTVLGA